MSHRFEGDDVKPDRAAVEKELREVAGVSKQNKYRMGELWLTIMKHDLWKDAGCRTPQEYLTQKFAGLDLVVKEMTRWASIARDFLAADLVFGVAKLLLLLTYAHLTAIRQLEGPGKLPILVPVKDGPAVEKTFEQCTEADLTEAIRHAEGTDVVTPIPPKAQERLESIRKELDGLTRGPIHATGKMMDNTLCITFAGVMDDELHVFANALAGLAARR